MRGNGLGFGTAPIHNPDAEILVPGAMIVYPEARARIGELDPECFFELQRRRAFEVISARIDAGEHVDPVMLLTVFQQDPDLGEELLAALVDGATTPFNAGEYAHELRRVLRRRQIADIALDLETAARQPQPGEDIEAYALAKLRQLPKVDGKHLAGVADWASSERRVTIELPPRKTYLEPILFEGSRTLLSGQTGVGKTMLTLSTVCAGINGSGVAGYTPGTHRPRVLYLDYEVGRRTMQKRLTGYANPNLFVVCFDDPELGDDGLLPLDTDAGQAQVLALIEALFVDIVVFDNLYSAVIGTIIGGPSDNSAVDKVTPFLRDLSKRGVASVLEHHSGHAADKAYGDDKMRWQMDNHVHLEFADSARDGELRLKLTEKKMRAERPRRAEPVELAYDSERKTWDVVEGGAKAPEMTGRQAWLAGTAMEMLDRTSHRVAERDYPVAYTKDLREAYKDKFWPHDRNGNGERQAWQRDVKACVTYFTVEAMYFYRCQKH